MCEEDGDLPRLLWDHPGTTEHRVTFQRALGDLDNIGRVCLASLLQVCKPLQQYTVRKLLDASAPEGDPSQPCGSSVWRVFMYDNDASVDVQSLRPHQYNYHADMGLLTVAPPSTWPSLFLHHPATGCVLQPERNLRPDEFIVFAGETLSFLSQGLLPAVLHGVPPVNAPGPKRCSCPFFQRVSVHAQLRDVDGATITGKAYTEKHAASLRPWRRRNQFGTDY